MTFSKPPIKYTDMAQWIDKNAMSPECDDNVLYRYLYHLVNMCAHELDLFRKIDDYDQFSLYCASRLLLRLKNPDSKAESQQVKSILNYIKFIIRPWRADYEHEFHVESDKIDTIPIGSFDLGDYMSDMISYHDVSAYSYQFTCDDVADIIRVHLSKIPRKRHSPEWHNIYISCLLTLQDRILYAIDYATQHESKDTYQLVTKAFNKARMLPPILFHLDKSMSGYINVLVVELQHAIAAELSYEMGMKLSPANAIKNLIYNALTENEED